MNKSDLILALSNKEKLYEKDATRIIETIFNGFTKALKKGDRIELRGFGSFSVRNYEGYAGRNPKTGMKVKVKPKKLPFFKVGKELQKQINSKVL
jgi:integration host factor subunit beta